MSKNVLGVASSAGDQHLTAHLVFVQLADDGELSVSEQEIWEGTRGQDPARQLIDLRDAIRNLLTSGSAAPDAVAVKRVELPFRGKPKSTYDDRVRFEGAAMMAAVEAGKRYFGYRKVELRRGSDLVTVALATPDCPSSDSGKEGVAAACAALSDLS